jgi:hypothetical protein
MVKMCVGSLVVLAALAAPRVQATETRIVGVLAGVDRHMTAGEQIVVNVRGRSVQVVTDGRIPSSVRETKSRKAAQPLVIHLDEQTEYMKWVTHEPWQQNTRADDEALVAGRCVAIELRQGGGTADLVRVSAEPAGSLFDPCQAMR